MNPYRTRVIDDLVRSHLDFMGAVVLEGARATGKTMTGLYHSASVSRVDIELSRQPLLINQPELFISGDAPRLIDEWQSLPSLWNLIRHEVDRRQLDGQFILTGSAVPEDDPIRHSGAGRFSRLRMRPFTLSEVTPPETPIRFRDLLHGTSHLRGQSSLNLEGIVAKIMAGGWPSQLERKTGAEAWVRSYVEEITRIDVAHFSVGTRRREPRKIARVMSSLARNVGAPLRISTIARDTAGDEGTIARDTIESYLEALRRVFILEEIPAWQPHLRSTTALRSSPKYYFVDPSIAPAILRMSSARLLRDLNYVGQAFENLVMRDVSVYAQASNAKVSYYRDDNGLEVDIIIEGDDGAWAAFEIKLGQDLLDDAATHLVRFSEKIDTERMGKPASLVILTGSGYAYTRRDGVHVVPIDLLVA